MGRDKADVEVSGVTMLDRVTSTLALVADRVVVLGGTHPDRETWPDRSEIAGPLAGLTTALVRMSEDRLLLIAVDNLFVRESTLRRLITVESGLPVVPVDAEGVRQVTCAIYPRAIARAAIEEAEAGGSIQTLLDRVSFLPITPDIWETWDEDGRSWYSVDTPKALETGLARYG